jgi:hypothetical protein
MQSNLTCLPLCMQTHAVTEWPGEADRSQDVCADASGSSERQDSRVLLPLPDVHEITGFSVRAMKKAHHAGDFPAITFQGRWYTHRRFVDLILEAVLSGRVTSVEEIGRAWIDGVQLQASAA